MYDLLIKNGTIIDGTGNKSYKNHILVKGNKIFKITDAILEAKEVIDADGLIVSPGFIDMHTHSDINFVNNETCDSKMYQGVTTEIAGCCGFSFYPSSDKNLDILKKYIDNNKNEHLISTSIESFIDKTKSYKKTINWGSYVGHGALRAAVVGFSNVKATDEQLEEMKAILDKELSKGAFGLSLGIEYPPGMFTGIEEFIELAKVVHKHGKIITSHIRDEGKFIFESIEEMIEIARQSKVHMHISHIKITYGNWHKAKELLKTIDDARQEELNITFEQYPYEASSTGLFVVLPHWAHDGGVEKTLERFKNQREEVIEGIKESMSYQMGFDRIVVVSTNGFLPEGDGKNIKEISEILNKSELETIIYLLENTNLNIPTVRFSMAIEDVYEIMKREDCAVISDGSSYSLDKEQVDGNPHPRNYGTFPRFLRLNRENNFMSLEKAIYKMTGLPASYINIIDRGILKEDYIADITIFNKDIISDTAEYNNSIQKPIGIEYVIVGGKIVVNEGIVTKERPGETILN